MLIHKHDTGLGNRLKLVVFRYFCFWLFCMVYFFNDKNIFTTPVFYLAELSFNK